MSPLGLQLTTIGSLGGETFMGGEAILIDDYWWELHPTLGTCYYTPIEEGTIIANSLQGTHDTWNIGDEVTSGHDDDAYTPSEDPKAEGLWQATKEIENKKIFPQKCKMGQHLKMTASNVAEMGIELRESYQSVYRGSFTVCMWYRKWPANTVYINESYLFGQEATGNTVLLAIVNNKPAFQFISNPGDGSANVQWLQYATNDLPAYNPNVYNHLAFVITKNSGGNSTVVIYVNGSAVALDSPTHGPITDTEQEEYTSSIPTWIGTHGSGSTSAGTYQDHAIKEVGFFNTALNAANIAEIYGMGGSTYTGVDTIDLTQPLGNYNSQNSLIGYWKMNEGMGQIANDKAHAGPTVSNGYIGVTGLHAYFE